MGIKYLLDSLKQLDDKILELNPSMYRYEEEKERLNIRRSEVVKSLHNIGSAEYTNIKERWLSFSIVLTAISLFILLILGGCWGYPEYSVWSSSKYGEGELKKAEWNRQISIREAEATFQSSKQLANAEIERAKGVAQANKIIGESLNNNESYLRYLWINNLQNNTNNQVIYVPAEGGLPVLEAGRLNHKKKISGE